MDKLKWKNYRNQLLTLAAAAAVICLIILLFFRTHLFTNAADRLISILGPFIYGFVIAYLLNPVTMAIEKLLKRFLDPKQTGRFASLIRLAAILLAVVLMFAAILILMLAVLPEMINSISGIIVQLPGAVREFSEWIEGLDHGETSHEIVTYVQDTINTVTSSLQNFLQTSVLPNLETIVSDITSNVMGIIGVLKNFGLGCIVASYLLGGKEKFLAQARMALYAILPGRAADWVLEEVHITDRMFSGFIYGKLVDSLIIGVICFIFCAITSMPYAVLIAVVVGVTNIIPFFGPYLGAVPSALLILMTNPVKCVVFLVFLIILQQVDGNVIGPAILGDKLGISGIWILFSILFFSSIWGIVGMLVGVPVFAVLYDLIRRGILKGLQLRGREDLSAEYAEKYREKD